MYYIYGLREGSGFDVVYVGCTRHIHRREAQHRTRLKRNVCLEVWAIVRTRAEARYLECGLIRRLRPSLNTWARGVQATRISSDNLTIDTRQDRPLERLNLALRRWAMLCDE